MNKPTLKALKACIKKYRTFAGMTESNPIRRTPLGAINCPLCDLFLYDTGTLIRKERDKCVGCPIKERMGKPGCQGTPYIKVAIAKFESEDIRVYAWQKACKAEADFLESLLPKKNETVKAKKKRPESILPA